MHDDDQPEVTESPAPPSDPVVAPPVDGGEPLAASAAPGSPRLEYRQRRQPADTRVAFILIALLALTMFYFGSIVDLWGPVGCFVVGGAFVIVSLTLWTTGKARPAYCLGAFVAGLAFASVGVAYNITHVPLTPNPAQAEAGLYYSSWLGVQKRLVGRGLAQGESVKLRFAPGPNPILEVHAEGISDVERGALAERLRSSFTGQNPGKSIEVRFVPGF